MSARGEETRDEHPLETLLEDALGGDNGGGKVTLGDIFDAFGDRSFGPVVALLSLLVILPPLGGVPGFPALVGLLIVLLAGQQLLGREQPWIPGRVRRIGFRRDKAVKARDNAVKVARRIDPLLAPRLQWAAGQTARLAAALCCILLSILFVPLELIPFAVALPASAVLFFGLGLAARDGLLMLIGFAITVASAAATASWLL
ncbi:MAG: exopolysaccharide biosynthesis protein [Sphingomonadaceae bacterium]